MKELIEKYYVFTLVFLALAGATIIFRNNADIVNIIIGCFVGLLTAPVVLPKSK